MPEDIILLHMCTINDDHMIYGFRNIRCDRQTFLVIFGFFCLFNPPPPPPPDDLYYQNFKKLIAIPGGIIILHMCTINDSYMMCGSSLRYGA